MSGGGTGGRALKDKTNQIEGADRAKKAEEVEFVLPYGEYVEENQFEIHKSNQFSIEDITDTSFLF